MSKETTFAERLDAAMVAAGMTGAGRNKKLAEMIGVTGQSVTKYLQGRSIPNPQRVEEIAKALGQAPDYFGDLVHSQGGRYVYHVKGKLKKSSESARPRDMMEMPVGDAVLPYVLDLYRRLDDKQRDELVVWMLGKVK